MCGMVVFRLFPALQSVHINVLVVWIFARSVKLTVRSVFAILLGIHVLFVIVQLINLVVLSYAFTLVVSATPSVRLFCFRHFRRVYRISISSALALRDSSTYTRRPPATTITSKTKTITALAAAISSSEKFSSLVPSESSSFSSCVAKQSVLTSYPEKQVQL